MASLPKLAIVGRPNVGKSALFNRICKQRIAIVDEAEGITRDRLYAHAEVFGRQFEVIDTGGINAHSKALFNEEIRRQAEIAIEEADTIIMVVDGRAGMIDLDAEVAKILWKSGRPVCLAVNKIDSFSQHTLIHQFHSLGMTKMIGVSALHGFQIEELLQEALDPIPVTIQEPQDEKIKVAIVGRTNVGKSTLVNALLDEERCIVSPIAGTTRDSIDISCVHEETTYTLIDTAGIRRKHAEHEVVDKFAAIRTERAIERADICVLVVDAKQGMTAQEKTIANQIEKEGKGCILLFNKWDLVKGHRMEHCLKAFHDAAPFLKYCPTVFGSAVNGRNLEKIFPLIKEVYDGTSRRIGTHELNKFVADAMQRINPPMIGGKRLRIYYMAQVDVCPPRFVLFVNRPNLMTEAYKKYLYNQFREVYGFKGSPLLFHLKGKVVKERFDLRKQELENPYKRIPLEDAGYGDEHGDAAFTDDGFSGAGDDES